MEGNDGMDHLSSQIDEFLKHTDIEDLKINTSVERVDNIEYNNIFIFYTLKENH